MNYKGQYEWTEMVQKYGVAFYQPILNFLYIGGIARRYDIQQEYGIYRTSSSLIPYDRFAFNGAEREIARSSINGIVPGIGIELYFLKLFEIRYTHEFVNLTGVKSLQTVSRLGGFVGIMYEDSKFKYRGKIQNFDFGMRLPGFNWILLRVGLTEEKLFRDLTSQYSGFVILNGFSLFNTSSPVAQTVSGSVYSANTDSEVKFRNVYFQFELNKAF